MSLILPTTAERALVSQELRVIVPPLGKVVDTSEKDKTRFVPASDAKHATIGACIRKVRLMVPSTPPLLFALDITPEAVGPNRGGYKLPRLSPGTTVPISLLPHQFIIAAAAEGFGVVSILIEHLDPDRYVS